MSEVLMRDADGLLLIDRAVAKDGRRDDLVAWFREAFELMAARESGLLTGTIVASTTDPNLMLTCAHYEIERGPRGASRRRRAAPGVRGPASSAP